MSDSSINVGFIGVGAMGAPLVKSLLKAGFPVAVYDVNPEAMRSISTSGAKTTASPADVAKTCDVIFTMLPNPAAVRAVIFGENGILEALKDHHLVVEMSTIDVGLTLDIARAVEGRGGLFLDAPVGGTPDKVETRDLEILVSGNRKEPFEKYSSIFEAMAKRVVFVGKAGNGKILKLTANAMIAINKIAAIEATSIAMKNGIDREVLLDVISHSTANSVVFERYGRTMVGEETQFAKRHTWHLKDLQLMEELCRNSGCSFFLGGLVHQIIQASCAEQGGGESIGASVKFYERVNRQLSK